MVQSDGRDEVASCSSKGGPSFFLFFFVFFADFVTSSEILLLNASTSYHWGGIGIIFST